MPTNQLHIAPDAPTGSTAGAVMLGPDEALRAVTDRRALPLADIMARARQISPGEVLDAQLLSFRGFLLYDLKILAANGDIADLYFYALSGNRVKTP